MVYTLTKIYIVGFILAYFIWDSLEPAFEPDYEANNDWFGNGRTYIFIINGILGTLFFFTPGFDFGPIIIDFWFIPELSQAKFSIPLYRFLGKRLLSVLNEAFLKYLYLGVMAKKNPIWRRLIRQKNFWIIFRAFYHTNIFKHPFNSRFLIAFLKSKGSRPISKSDLFFIKRILIDHPQKIKFYTWYLNNHGHASTMEYFHDYSYVKYFNHENRFDYPDYINDFVTEFEPYGSFGEMGPFLELNEYLVPAKDLLETISQMF